MICHKCGSIISRSNNFYKLKEYLEGLRWFFTQINAFCSKECLRDYVVMKLNEKK